MTEPLTEKEALELAVEILGQSGMAREITARTGKQVKQQHVWNWINRSGRLPERFAFAVEAATKDKGRPVRADHLCHGSFTPAGAQLTNAPTA